MSKGLELAFPNFRHIHWPKHITRSAQTQRLAEKLHLLLEGAGKLHAKEHKHGDKLASVPIFCNPLHCPESTVVDI